MSETISSNPHSISTISFSELLSLFFKGLIRGLKDLILFLSRNMLLIILFMIVGIGIGYLNFSITPPFYKVSAIVRQTEMTTDIYGQMIASLNKLAETGSYNELGHSLDLEPSLAKQIRSVTAENLDGSEILKDTSATGMRSFVIRMTIGDQSKADTLQQSIIDYFNNNIYLNKLKQDKIHLYTERLAFFNSELTKIDSLKDVYIRSLALSRSATSVYNNAFNPGDLFRESQQYAANKQVTEEWLLQQKQSLLVIDNVKPSLVPASRSMMMTIAIYTVIFFLAGCLLGRILELIK